MAANAPLFLLGIQAGTVTFIETLPEPPEGFAFRVTDTGAYRVTSTGAYRVVPLPA